MLLRLDSESSRVDRFGVDSESSRQLGESTRCVVLCCAVVFVSKFCIVRMNWNSAGVAPLAGTILCPQPQAANERRSGCAEEEDNGYVRGKEEQEMAEKVVNADAAG